MTKSEILQETVNFYGQDPTRRCPGRFNGRDAGQHCAVGRFLKPELQAQGYEMPGNDGSARYLNERVREKSLHDCLNEEVQGHGTEFWTDLLKWHDEDGNFNNAGLTTPGMMKANLLKKRYHADQAVFFFDVAGVDA